MKNRLALFAAASMAAGTFAFIGYDSSVFAQQEPDRPGAAIGAAAAAGRMELPAGITRSDRADEAGIRRTLAGAVEAVLQPDGLKNLGNYVASNDRTRLADFARDDQQLTQKIERLRQQFKAKYNQDFDIKDEVVFGEQFRGFQVVQGEVSNPALLSNWPVDATKSGTTPGAPTTPPGAGEQQRDQAGPGQPGAGQPGAGQPGAGQPGAGDRPGAGAMADRPDRGMNVAIVTFPASHGAPELNVSLIRETKPGAGAGAGAGQPGAGADAGAGQPGAGADAGAGAGQPGAGAGAGADLASGDWRIDVPNTLTPDQLKQSLNKHLDQVLGMEAQWPADANEAYRAISHHILYAFYDQGAAGAGGEGGARPGGAGAGGEGGLGGGGAVPPPGQN